jgi:hypothetical protein
MHEIVGLYFFSFPESATLERIPPPGGGQVGPCRTKDFLSDKDTTCSVRLNRESSFVGLLRDVHGVLWSDEACSSPLTDFDFAKLQGSNRLVNSVLYDV